MTITEASEPSSIAARGCARTTPSIVAFTDDDAEVPEAEPAVAAGAVAAPTLAGRVKTLLNKEPKAEAVEVVEVADKSDADTETAVAEKAVAAPAATPKAKESAANKADTAKAEPAKVERAEAEPAKAEPAKAEAAKVEPANVEAAKVEPAKAEPAKTDPVTPDDSTTRSAVVAKASKSAQTLFRRVRSRLDRSE